MIENGKVVTLLYDLYVDGVHGDEELMESATTMRPLTYCHGEGMMLPKFEENMNGLNEGDTFDFRIDHQDAYGEYDTDGVMELPKSMFFNGDGEFDSERVMIGAIVPMNTSDGQVVNAQVCEITNDKVTIDLNHPLAGENLHFVGSVLNVRDVTPAELEAIRHPHKCGHCKGKCDECNNECNNENNCNGEHSCNCGKA
ncbi:MAG: FKBP-type peptidyl-prolyl cis-trans isomerase [Paludibacteraceae bacterium]|nr:FKBP-type peptidyl-prolyl cis-trans isomerase [Paludibacteraceae bacterium]